MGLLRPARLVSTRLGLVAKQVECKLKEKRLDHTIRSILQLNQQEQDLYRAHRTITCLQTKVHRNERALQSWRRLLIGALRGRLRGILVLFVEDARAQLALSNPLPSHEHEPYPFSHIFQSPVYDTLKAQLSTAAETDDVPTLVSKLHDLARLLDQNYNCSTIFSCGPIPVAKAWLKDDHVCFQMLKCICEHMHFKVMEVYAASMDHEEFMIDEDDPDDAAFVQETSSFGIFLCELITGRKAIDEESNIH